MDVSLLKRMKAVVIDVEGNGQTPPDLIEVAIQNINDAIEGDFAPISWLIKPPRPILSRVIRVHGITNEALIGCPSWNEVQSEIYKALNDAWIIGHNIKVDYEALRLHLPEWQPLGMLDTIVLARNVWPGLKSYSLDYLAEFAKLNLSAVAGKRHRAAYDVWVTWQLFLVLIIDCKALTLEDLLLLGQPNESPRKRTSLNVQRSLF
ncbi:MAG: 3'-5' exonuclease [Gallionellaceae bacterium]|jgi:DNA polymerase III epsilon subunit-like protein